MNSPVRQITASGLFMLVFAGASVVLWWAVQSWASHVDISLDELHQGRAANATHIAEIAVRLEAMKETDIQLRDTLKDVSNKIDQLLRMHLGK